MDVRIAQLEKMRQQMKRREGETDEEYKERTQAIGLAVSTEKVCECFCR